MTALTATGKQSFSLTPTSLQEAMQFSDMIANSNLVPNAYKGKPGDVLVAIQMGMEVGLQPMQALQGIAVINGKPAMYGDALIGVVRNSPVCEAIQEHYDESTQTAICRVKRRGEDWQERTFSRQEAELAKLWGKQGPWTQYPKRMLQMRARAWALRDVFPDALQGMAVAEEVRDMAPEKEINPVQGQPTTKPASKAQAVLARVKANNQPEPQASAGPGQSASAFGLDDWKLHIREAGDAKAWQEAYAEAWSWAQNQDAATQQEIKAVAGEVKRRIDEQQ